MSLATRRLLWLTGLLAAVAASLLVTVAVMTRTVRHPGVLTISILGEAFADPPGPDSQLYMAMGEAAFEAPGHVLYRQLFLVEHHKFIYPPSSLFFTEALALAPRLHLSAEGVFKTLLVLGWLGSIVLGVAVYREGRRQRGEPVSPLPCAAVALLGVLFIPFAMAFYAGQVQTLLMGLWGAAVLLWMQRRHGWAGAVLALSCVFKPQMALFLLWGALRREWRFSAAFLAVLAVIEAAAVARFGLQNNLDYLAVLSFLSRHGESIVGNQSMAGLMNRLLRNGDPIAWEMTIYPPYRAAVYYASTGFAALLLLAGLVVPWRGRWQGTTADLLFFGCASTLLSPIVWRHHYSVFFFLIAYLLARAEQLTTRRWAVLAAATLAMGSFYPPLDHFVRGPVSLVDDYVFYAGLALLVLLALEMRGRDREPRVPAALAG